MSAFDIIESRPRWRVPLPGQLSVTLLVWLIGSVLLAESIWLLPSYINKSQEVWSETEAATRKLVRVTVDPQAPNTLITEKDIFWRLKAVSSIVGMRIEDTRGETLALLGNPPGLTSLEARKKAIGAQPAQQARYLDIHLPASETMLAHNIVARIDMAPHFAALSAWLKTVVEAIAAITLFMVLIGYCSLYFVLIRPVLKVHESISSAMDNVSRGRIVEIEVGRNDEIGGIAKFTNKILYELARSYNTTTAIATRSLDESRIPSIVYDPKWTPIYANKSARKLFAAKDISAIKGGDEKFFNIVRAGAESECSLAEMFDSDAFIREAVVDIASGPIKVLCIGYANGAEAGDTRQYTVQFVDVGLFLNRIDKLSRDKEQENAKRKEAERQAVTSKLTLESCMILMGRDDDFAGKAGGLVDLPDIISKWALTRGSAGMGRPIRYNELPKIAGNRDQIAAMFNQALGFIDYRSIFEVSEIRIIASAHERMIHFEISEKAGEDRTLNTRPASGGSEEWTLCFAALNRLVKGLGGGVEANPQRPGPATLTVMVPKIIGGRNLGGKEDADQDMAAA